MRAAANVLLFTVSLVITLVTADVVIGKVWNIPVSWPIVKNDPAFFPSKSLKPHLDVKLSGAYREFVFRLRTDKEGFRISSGTDSCLGQTDVLFLGDSQTLGIGVEDSQTFPSYFATISGQCVLNTACHGYSNVEELFLAERLFKEKKSSVAVLCFFAGNDAYENVMDAEWLEGEKKSALLDMPTKAKNLKQFLSERSAIYNLLKRLRRYPPINRALRSIKAVNEAPPGELQIFNTDEKKSALEWQLIEKVLQRLNRAARDNNVTLFVLFIPDRLQVEPPYWRGWSEKYTLKESDYDLSLPNRKLKRLCQLMKIPFIDATPTLAESYQRGEAPYWKLDSHLSVKGNEIIGQLLKDKILGLLTHNDMN